MGNRLFMETRTGTDVETFVTYGYDQLNRVDTVRDHDPSLLPTLPTVEQWDDLDTDTNAAITDLAYNPIGQMTSISRPNGITSNYTYDPDRYFVDEIVHLNGSTVLGRYEYDYDAVGNRTDMTVTAGDGSVTDFSYDYDRANRLIEETYNLLGATSSTYYQYDRAGNRTQMSNSEGTTTYQYNANDELDRVDTPDYHYDKYEYDARGNLISIQNYSEGVIDTPIGNATLLQYNARDQLDSFGMGGASVVTYDYDYRGNRIAETISGSTRNYLWDEFSYFEDVVLETTIDKTISYTLAGGMLISQSNDGNVGYFLQDAQGSTIGYADDTGMVTSEYTYDAFGNLDESVDPLSLETSYLYTGQQFDALYTELYNLRARQYDPNIGRFLTRDTWAYNYQNPFELNRYAYTANNPVRYKDPSGYTSGSFDYAAAFVQGFQAGFRAGGVGGFAGSVFYTLMAQLGGCGDASREWFLNLTNVQSFVGIRALLNENSG